MNLCSCQSSDLADKVAYLSAMTLKQALIEHAEATWVLAGGHSFQPVYQVLAYDYAQFLDWSKVWFLIGDERYVPADDPESNWSAVQQNLISKLKLKPDRLLAPRYFDNLDQMALDYEKRLNSLAKVGDSPRFDLVYLGIGEDGHSLSLFPGSAGLKASSPLVITVKDSPKPPSQRISLSLAAFKQVNQAVVVATGDNKAAALKRLIDQDQSIPISRIVNFIESNNGQVSLVTDNLLSASITKQADY